MASLMRKHRKQAGASGRAYQAEQRDNARKVERARRIAEDIAIPVGFAPPDIGARAELALQRHRLERLLGPIDAKRAVEALDRYVTTVGDTRVGVGEQAIRDLSRGAKPWHLEALRSGWPEGEPPSPVLVGETDTPPPAAGIRLARRMPLLQQALVVSMLLGLASSPKEDL